MKAADTDSPARVDDAPLGLAAPWRWLVLACLFLVSCAPFLPALSQGFVEWDDNLNFVNNPYWRGLSSQNIEWMFSTMYMGHYQPLSWMSFAIEFEMWGLNPERMHLVNLLIHGLNAVLFARLATRLLAWSSGVRAGAESTWAWIGGACAALFFALHPLRVESVAWATERRDVLSTLFLLSTVLCWLRTKDASPGRALWWIATLMFYGLSLLSKAWGMTLPALIVLLELYPLRRAEPSLRGIARAALSTWPFVPLAGWCAYKAASSQESIMAAVSWSEHGLMQRLAQATWGSAFYVWKTVAPSGLSPLYELEEQFDPWQRDYMIATVSVAALTLILFFARKRFPAGLAAWCAFLILASPVLGLLQSGAQKAADRYTYLACMPLAALAGAGVAWFVRRRSQRGWRDPLLGATALALVAIWTSLGLAASAQTRIWKDSESLWRQVIAVQPESYIAHHNLAATIGQTGRVKEAIELEERCIQLRPGKGNVEARHYLGTLRQRNGEPDLALEAWTAAFRVDPEHANVVASLDAELARRGQRTRLFELFDEVLASNPRLVGARVVYAGRLAGQGRASDAESQLKLALSIDPRSVPALLGLGRMYLSAGRAKDAEPLLLNATRLDPRNPDAFTELGAVRAAQGQLEAAILLWNQALMLAPDHPRALGLLRQHSGGGR